MKSLTQCPCSDAWPFLEKVDSLHQVLRLSSKIKHRAARLLGRPEKAKWLAPVRTLRTKCGLRRIPKNFSDCKRILVVRPDAIGDTVMTSPFFRNLRKAAPEAKISALVNPTCASLLKYCPYIDEVHSLPFSPTVEPHAIGNVVANALKVRWKHFPFGFDLVLLPRPDADWYGSELAAHVLAGAGAVVINSAAFIKWSINPPKSPSFADVHIKLKTVQSDVLSNLELLKVLGADVADNYLEFWSSPEDRNFAANWLAAGDAQRRKVIFHPPSGRSSLKRWPSGRTRELLDKIVSETEFEVILVGGDQDAWVREELKGADKGRFRLALDAFTLPQLGEVIRQCGYFIGGDSGPMHIAAAVGAKVLGIFGYASETRFCPWSDAARVVSLRFHCSPDMRGTYEANCFACMYPENCCLTELSADQVLSEALEIFNLKQGAGVFGEDRVPDKT